MRKAVIGILVAIAAGACSANPARTSTAVPLVIPEPPARVALDPIQAAEPPAEPVPVPASKPTAAIPQPTPPRRSSSPAPAPPPPAAQAVEPPRATPPPDLLPVGPFGSPTISQVRDSLTRTKQKLDSIDRGRLNAGQRADYDSARRFLAQAEGAVKVNNLLLAESSVEKAETLADGLR